MNIGKIIYGFCSGWFGRDDYNDKIIIAEGENWIVCKYVDGIDSNEVTFASFKSKEEKNNKIEEWSIESES